MKKNRLQDLSVRLKVALDKYNTKPVNFASINDAVLAQSAMDFFVLAEDGQTYRFAILGENLELQSYGVA